MALISKLNIENGSLIDTVSGLQATIVGSKLHFEQTKQGYMLSADGTNGNYVDIPNSSTMTNTGDWSVTIGVQFDIRTNAGGLITKYTENINGWGLINLNNNIRFVYGSNFKDIVKIVKRKLFFSTITYSPNSLKLYIDGVLKHTIATTIIPNTHLITLGRYSTLYPQFNVAGKMGTPSIYNHALSQEEINQLYKEWLQPKPTLNLQREAITTLPIEYKEEGLVAAYSGNLVNNKWLDKSGNERHGTVVGDFVNVENGLQSNQKGYISYNSSGLYQGIVTVVGRLKSNIYLSPLINNKNGGGVGTSDAWGINIFPAYITYDINGTINGRQIIQLSSGANRLSKFTDIAIEMNFNNLTVKAFINGVLTDSKTFLQPSLTNQTVGYIMSVVNYNSALGFNGTVKELLIYNRALSQQEITAYHAKWIKPTLIEKWNYGADGVVKTIPNWINKSGAFKIKEFVKQNGELVSNGNMELGNPDATGWSFLNGERSKVTGNGFNVAQRLYCNVTANTVLKKDIPLKVGGRYRVEFKHRSNSGLAIYHHEGNTYPLPPNINDALTNVYYMTSFQPLTYLRFYVRSTVGNAVAGDWIEISDVSITEIDPLLSITTGTNYLECVTAGTIALPNNWAYGTTIFDIYKAVDNNQPRVGILSSKITSTNEWSIVIENASYKNAVRLQRLNTSNIINTNNNYITTGTWYSIKITRTTLGKFTMYIKGGNFGNEFVLMSATNNPTTDNNYTTSNYTVLTMGAGDRIGEIKQYNEAI